MKEDAKLFINLLPKAEAVAARREAARQLRNSEAAALDVAALCAQAVKTARLHNIPHAGVGGRVAI